MSPSPSSYVLKVTGCKSLFPRPVTAECSSSDMTWMQFLTQSCKLKVNTGGVFVRVNGRCGNLGDKVGVLMSTYKNVKNCYAVRLVIGGRSHTPIAAGRLAATASRRQRGSMNPSAPGALLPGHLQLQEREEMAVVSSSNLQPKLEVVDNPRRQGYASGHRRLSYDDVASTYAYTSLTQQVDDLHRDGIRNREIKRKIASRLSDKYQNPDLLRIEDELRSVIKSRFWQRVMSKTPRVGNLLQDLFAIYPVSDNSDSD